MPCVKVDTSIKLSQDDKKKISQALGRIIDIIPGKSERWLMTKIEDDLHMTFAGSDDPCAVVEVGFFGEDDGEVYDRMTKAIYKEVVPLIGISPDRMFVKYDAGTHWGWNGNNF